MPERNCPASPLLLPSIVKTCLNVFIAMSISTHMIEDDVQPSQHMLLGILGLFFLRTTDSKDNEQLSESACSFHTDTMTVSSMAMFRDPTIIPSSPGQPGRSAASSAPEAKTDAHIAVPQMTARALKQVELSLGSNALARRRREDRTDQMEKDEKEDVFEQVFLTQ